MIPIARPLLDEKEINAVADVLKSGMLAQGKKVSEFEKRFASYVGSKYAVAVINGTTALHLALLAHNIGESDEIITSPFSFISSATPILFVGASPVFVDIGKDDFCIDPQLIEKSITKKTKAIIPVHLYGQSANMSQIMKIARKHNLLVIEDACQAHGAKYKKKSAGNIGHTGFFSFYPTKNMTSGEGGIVTTNSKRFAEKLHLLRNHGQIDRYYSEIIGFNLRMTDIAAAIGIEQLKKLDGFNKKRQANASYFNKFLSRITGLVLPIAKKGREHVYHQYTMRVTPDYPVTRDQLIELLKKNEIGSSVFYPLPITKQKPFVKMGLAGTMPVAEATSKEVISIPAHPLVTSKDLRKIVSVLSNPLK